MKSRTNTITAITTAIQNSIFTSPSNEQHSSSAPETAANDADPGGRSRERQQPAKRQDGLGRGTREGDEQRGYIGPG